jgi:hypothetical protein
MKKSGIFFVLFVLVLMVLVVFAQLYFLKKAVAGDNVKKKDDNLFEKRIVIINEWLDSFNGELGKIDNVKLEEIRDFFKKKVIIGAPRSCGVETLFKNKNKEENLIIVPVLESDVALSDEWKDFYRSKLALEFYPKERILLLNSRIKFGSKSQALALAHEGYDALESIINCGNEEQCAEYYNLMEKDAQIFQNKLAGIIGGQLYRKIVSVEAQKIYIVMERKKNDFGYFLPNPEKYNPKLKKIFGKPKSKDEEEFIRTNVWVNAVFVAIEKEFSDNVSEEKELFLKSVFKK